MKQRGCRPGSSILASKNTKEMFWPGIGPKKKKLKLVAPPRIAKSHKRMYEREDKYVNDELGSTYQMPLKMKNFQNMKSLGRNS